MADNLLQSKAMRDTADKFRRYDCLGILKEIREGINKALEGHTEEEIINKLKERYE